MLILSIDRAGCESEEIFAEKIDAVEEYIDKSTTKDLQKVFQNNIVVY